MDSRAPFHLLNAPSAQIPPFSQRSILIFFNNAPSATQHFSRGEQNSPNSPSNLPIISFPFPLTRLFLLSIHTATGFRPSETIPLKKHPPKELAHAFLIKRFSRTRHARKIPHQKLVSGSFWIDPMSKQCTMTQFIQNLVILFSIQPDFAFQVLILKTKPPPTSKKSKINLQPSTNKTIVLSPQSHDNSTRLSL